MPADVSAYTAEILRQRQQRAEMLLADRSWFTLAGLFWLQPGVNRFGAASDNAIVLPAHSAPAWAGNFALQGDAVELQPAPDAPLLVNDEATTRRILKPDASGAPDYVLLGELTMLVLQRGGRYAIRLFDRTNPARAGFTGLRWYPVDPACRIQACFDPYAPAKTITFVDVLGDSHEVASPGALVFAWQGQECRLDAQLRGERLFFNFADLTNRDATHGAGRFLYTELPKAGVVTVDFNLATNPFCAYTIYATCPLPPVQNRLPVRIEAGELRYPLHP